MTDETRTHEAEADTEEQPVNEASTAEASAPEAVAEVEAAAEEPAAEETSAEDESAPEAVAEVEAAAEEPAAEETSAEDESAPEAVAEVEAAAEEPAAEETSAEEESAPEAVAEVEQVAFNRVEGPANFNRAKQGNQRRNPRHVGSDVRIDEINYKNVLVLSRFVDNYGRIHNRRKTRVTAKMQRKVTRAIKRARHLALMPYTGEHMRITGRRS
jgi:ribosomal protein S18